jgi:succinyl-diaminopimelate desuccinylase
VNAVSAAARLVEALEELALPAEPDPAFAFGPRLTVTAAHGGEAFSVVPDRCVLHVDMRVTPRVIAAGLRDLVERRVAAFRADRPDVPAIEVAWEQAWPAYRLADDSPALTCLRSAAARAFGRPVPAAVSGPSNIGNYLAGLGIPAVAGFGVTYGDVHAADEWAVVDGVAPVYEAYRASALAFLAAPR